MMEATAAYLILSNQCSGNIQLERCQRVSQRFERGLVESDHEVVGFSSLSGAPTPTEQRIFYPIPNATSGFGTATHLINTQTENHWSNGNFNSCAMLALTTSLKGMPEKVRIYSRTTEGTDATVDGARSRHLQIGHAPSSEE
jgi:hypothetical protein